MEGADRPFRMVIPSGRYAPEFVAAPRPAHEPPLPLPFQEAVSEPGPHLTPVAPGPSGRRWIYLTIPALAILAAAAAAYYGRHPVVRDPDKPDRAVAVPSKALTVPQVTPGTVASVPVRVLAGYTGQPFTDGAGRVWGSDKYFEGGRPSQRGDARTARTNNPFLFQHARIGDFSYAIPLPPAVYELHLYFIESEYGPEYGTGENDRTIFLHINDRRIVPEVDIESDGMGTNVADERVFKNVQPASDGKLHIAFESGRGVPLVNAIEILAGIPNRQLPIRMVAQPVPFTGHDGAKWQPDNYYLNGRVVPRNLVVTGTPDPGLFAVERYGHFTYAIPVDVQSRYSATLHFAELYFGPNATGGGGVGSRVFNVMCNGVSLLADFDVFKAAGSGHAISKTFHNLKPTAQGKLNFTFEPVVNYALVSAIEVTDESP